MVPFPLMASPLLLALILSTASLGAVGVATVDSVLAQPLSVYEALQSFNFPSGLLPKGALGYDLDNRTGSFSVYFKESCRFSLEGSYQLQYQPTISGRIATNRLSDLRGVSVKVLLFWINIIEVIRSTEELEFSVGIASADFSIDNFYVSPQCGCGLNCGTVGNLAEKGDLVKFKSTI